MAKLRHLAIATDDPDRTAQFYIDTFEFTKVRSAEGIWGHGHILSDGTIGYRGLHHIGFEVDDVDEVASRVESAGCRARDDIDAALGIPHDGPIKGEFKYEGPDGVVFDLSQPGVWQLS
jgi:glyoxylase I family protein